MNRGSFCKELTLVGSSECISTQNLMYHKTYFNVSVTIWSQVPFKIFNPNFSVPNIFLITNLFQKICKEKSVNIEMESSTWRRIHTGLQISTVQCQLHNLPASHLKATEFPLIKNISLGTHQKTKLFPQRKITWASDILKRYFKGFVNYEFLWGI